MAIESMDKEAPKVSVGLPVYNGERYLRTSIESILQQTYRDFEFIIVDNRSTDRTEEICREYAARDKRIQYHRNDVNIGAPRNFNKVFQLSRGTYLKWCTADDYVAPDYIEKCLEVMEHNSDVVLCYPRAVLIDAEGAQIGKFDDVLTLQQPLASERFINLVRGIRLAHHHLGLIRTAQLKRTALHGTHVAADINFLAELSLYGKFYELPEYLLYRRFHPGSSSWERKNQKVQVQWSDPLRVGLRLDRWAAMRCFFSAVKRSPASSAEKRRMYRYLLHRMYWDKQRLLEEVTGVVRSVGNRLLSTARHLLLLSVCFCAYSLSMCQL